MNYFEDILFKIVFPLAFIEHLKQIEFYGLNGGEIEDRLAQFFINKGKSLEIISLRDLQVKLLEDKPLKEKKK